MKVFRSKILLKFLNTLLSYHQNDITKDNTKDSGNAKLHISKSILASITA